MTLTPAIFTFYSFKGGVGRSMAAVNVAYALVARGQRVLLLDMDLEAPGVSGLMTREGELPTQPPRCDVLDLVQWVRDVARKEPTDPEDLGWLHQASLPSLELFISEVPVAKLASLRAPLGTLGLLHVIGADTARSYADRLTNLRLSDLSSNELVRASTALRYILKQYRLQLPVPDYYGSAEFGRMPYDYVLIDSRTGLTETGGLCVGPVADRLVVLCGLNDQNIHGTIHALQTLGISDSDNLGAYSVESWDADIPPLGSLQRPPFMGRKPTILVASPVPYGDLRLESERLTVMESSLGGKVAAKLTYHPQLAFHERIFVRDYPDELLTFQYASLAEIIEAAVGNHPQQNTSFDLSDDATKLTDELSRALKLAERDGNIGEHLLHRFANSLSLEIVSDRHAVALDRLFRWMTQPEATQKWVGLSKWALLLRNWSKFSPHSPWVGARRREALKMIEAVLSMPQAKPKDRRAVQSLRAEFYFAERRWDEAIADFSAATEGASGTAQGVALVGRGMAYRAINERAQALSDLEAALQIPELPKCMRIKAWLCRGMILAQQGEREQALVDFNHIVKESEEELDDRFAALLGRAMLHKQNGDFQAALNDFTEVIQKAGEYPERKEAALVNRGELLRRLDRFDDAIADCTTVLGITPTESVPYQMALVNRALTLADLERFAEAAQDAEAALRLTSLTPELRRGALVAAVISYAGHGSLAVARSHFDTLNSLPDVDDSHRAACLLSLGWAAYLCKDYEQAVNWSRQAVTEYKKGPGTIAQGNLGLALLQTEKWSDGVDAYKQFLESCRNRAWVAVVLKDLEDARAIRPDLPEATNIGVQLKQLLDQL